MPSSYVPFLVAPILAHGTGFSPRPLASYPAPTPGGSAAASVTKFLPRRPPGPRSASSDARRLGSSRRRPNPVGLSRTRPVVGPRSTTDGLGHVLHPDASGKASGNLSPESSAGRWGEGLLEARRPDTRSDANQVEHLRIWAFVRGRHQAADTLARRAFSSIAEHGRNVAGVDFESVGRRFESCRGYHGVTGRTVGSACPCFRCQAV